ncbi:hypothetical protein [Thalassotalea mangrovi]|uniref:Uncharacterized protein n=1 Tax=Thalassotalea mangrovi TaxID=2572245 RepID=A0A4U1B3B3_9GAMM|nr:hypothetical protein [Thalassotalea mangrovi]TKB44404.1 hypothetical protein E8M12_12180 [Thalassotalea mangrovi]
MKTPIAKNFSKPARILVVVFLFIASMPIWFSTALDLALRKFPHNPALQELGWRLEHPLAQKATFYRLQPGSRQWLHLGRKLGEDDGDVALMLYQFFSSSQPRQANLWLKKAITLGNPQAYEIQVRRLIDSNQLDKAHRLIESIANAPESYWSLKLQIALELEQGSDVLEAINHLSETAPTHLMLAEVEKFSITDYWQQQKLRAGALAATRSCPTSVQFYASSLNQLNRISRLQELLNNEPFFAREFCFYSPRYVPKSVLGCSDDSDLRLECDVDSLADTYLRSTADYVGIIAENGRANVNNGILYLDVQDDIQVFKHELMHLVGFIDEYSLPGEHQVCQVDKFAAIAKNIVVSAGKNQQFESEQQAREQLFDTIPWSALIKDSTPVTQVVDGVRVLGTPSDYQGEVGLFAAQTCDNHYSQGYKPTYRWGLMRYNSLALSEVYQRIHRLNRNRFAMQKFIEHAAR